MHLQQAEVFNKCTCVNIVYSVRLKSSLYTNKVTRARTKKLSFLKKLFFCICRYSYLWFKQMQKILRNTMDYSKSQWLINKVFSKEFLRVLCTKCDLHVTALRVAVPALSSQYSISAKGSVKQRDRYEIVSPLLKLFYAGD